MNLTKIESSSKRSTRVVCKSVLRCLCGAASFAVVWTCLAANGWAQVPQVPSAPRPSQIDPGGLVLNSPAPPQCPSQAILAGVDDGFSTTDGAELAAPSVTLQATVGGPFTDFDGTEANKHFAHTFKLPSCKCLVGAKLEFRGKSIESGSNNDGVTLGFSTLAGFPHWSQSLSSGLIGSGPVYSLDLAALPTGSGQTISLLSAIQMNHYLDFYVQDDTSIDYIKLTVTMCDCCQQEGRSEICLSKFYDQNRNGIKDGNEPWLTGWTFQIRDQAGGSVITSPPTKGEDKVCVGVPAPATYSVSEIPQQGWIQTTPVNPAIPLVTVTPGGAPVNLLFGNWRKKGLDPQLPDTKNPG